VPFQSGLRVVVVFSFVTAWSMLTWFERLNREVYTLLHPMIPQNKTGKTKKERSTRRMVTSP
jgi:hypothetical protein